MLNKYQQALIQAIRAGGKVIGEACPGSGKTRTMEEAVSTLINEDGIHPSRIGVFTFSKKSAAEARRRIGKTIIPDISDSELEALENGEEYDNEDIWSEPDPRREMIRQWVCTIHAMSYRILRANGHKVQMAQKQQVWDIQAIVKDGLQELEWDESPKAVWLWIGKITNSLMFAEDYLQTKGLSSLQVRNLVTLYYRYMAYMTKHNLVDFDMMQANLVELLNENKIDISNMFDFVFIDEAQDNNALQNEIIGYLCQKANLIMIGDVDQALYSFRGARPEVLRSIEGAVRLNLPINYRSTQVIVEASARLIAYSYSSNEFLKPFQFRPDAPEGETIGYIEAEEFNNLTDEIINIVNVIESSKLDSFGDIAILSRTRAECAAIHTALVAANIPAINHSGGLLFGSPHIRKVLAYAHLACNYQGARDNLEILSEIANVAGPGFKAPMTRRRHSPNCYAKPWQDCGCPVIVREGIDNSHVRYYGAKAIQEAGSWSGIKRQMLETNKGGYPSLNSKGATDLVRFVEALEAHTSDAYACISFIVDTSVKPHLMHEEGLSEEDLSENGKTEDFALLLEMCDPGMTLEQFLDKVEWLSKQASGASKDAVNIGTIHWSKGAEFKKVIVNLTRCPLQIPPQDPRKLPTGSPPTIEEERRLAFVAVSRAKEECYIVQSLEWLGQPARKSRFVEELGL